MFQIPRIWPQGSREGRCILNLAQDSGRVGGVCVSNFTPSLMTPPHFCRHPEPFDYFSFSYPLPQSSSQKAVIILLCSHSQSSLSTSIYRKEALWVSDPVYPSWHSPRTAAPWGRHYIIPTISMRRQKRRGGNHLPTLTLVGGRGEPWLESLFWTYVIPTCILPIPVHPPTCARLLFPSLVVSLS